MLADRSSGKALRLPYDERTTRLLDQAASAISLQYPAECFGGNRQVTRKIGTTVRAIRDRVGPAVPFVVLQEIGRNPLLCAACAEITHPAHGGFRTATQAVQQPNCETRPLL